VDAFIIAAWYIVSTAIVSNMLPGAALIGLWRVIFFFGNDGGGT
jgi:hypothetical protein